MNRIYHARIAWYQYVYIFLLAAIAFYSLWMKLILVAAVLMLLLIVIIEKVIHTTYTFTPDGMLIISYGRYARKLTIRIDTITKIEKKNSMNFARFHATEYLLIEYGQEKYVSLMPVKEDDFIVHIQQQISQ
ncbi:MAG: PH domain-containing protein [Bacteroides sp.]